MASRICFQKKSLIGIAILIAIGSDTYLNGNTLVLANTIHTESIDTVDEPDVLLSVDEYSRSTNDFSQNFMSRVWDSNPNFVFSPLSIHITLSMLASSATENSETQKQLLRVLGRTSNLQHLEAYYRSTLNEYEKTSESTLKFGNMIWTTKEFYEKVNNSYLLSLDKNYKTGFKLLGDENPEDEINNWIAAVTNNKINQLYDQLPDDITLLLTNAIWFKDSWNEPFDPVLESDRKSFHLSNGSDIQAEMMERTSYEFAVSNEFEFKELTQNQKFLAIAVPYEFDQSKRFEIVFVIPEKLKGLEFLKDALARQDTDSVKYQNIFDTIDTQIQEARKQSKEYTVVMPMFKIASTIQAEKYLRQMGVKNAFDVGEFGHLANGVPLKVSGVKHKATVEVTVEGTEGAAATGIDLVPLSFSDFREVRIDRPFIFFIRDRLKGSFLFVGKIENPNDAHVAPK